MRSATLLLAIHSASRRDPDERAALTRVLAMYDAMEHDVLPFEEIDVAARFLVGHGFVTVEHGEIFRLTAMGFAATAGTASAATAESAVALVRPRLDGLDEAAVDGPPALDRHAYATAVREHVPQRTPPPASPAPPAVTRTAPRSAATAAKVAGVIGAGAALGMLGLPSAVVTIAAAGVGTTVVVSDIAARRAAGALARVAPADLARYALQVPAERVAVGPRMQLRLLPPTSRIWAPGLFCVDAARRRARFVAAQERHADRDWAGAFERLEVLRVGAGNRTASVVRVHGSADEAVAQFVVQGRLVL